MYFNVSVRAVVDPEYSVKREEVIGSSPTSVVPEGKLIIGAERQ
jgi:hypothetical protein